MKHAPRISMHFCSSAPPREWGRGIRFFYIMIFAFAFLFASRPVAATIQYEISLANLQQHLFLVTVRIPNPQSNMVVALPAWNALYQVRDFAYRVRNVEVVP